MALWWFRDRFRSAPGMWVMLLLCLVHTLVLWRMALVVRYVSERHVLVLVMCGVYWSAAGFSELAYHLAALCTRSLRWVRWAPAALMVAFIAAGLPKTLKPLHANRAGHHAAGMWLAEHADPTDEVFDPFCWAHFYAGRVFQEGKPAPAPAPGYQPKTYVVLEPHDDLDVRGHLLTRARELIASGGQLVFHWPEQQAPDMAEVQVFAVSHVRQ
jgi:hypothetical protein